MIFRILILFLVLCNLGCFCDECCDDEQPCEECWSICRDPEKENAIDSTYMNINVLLDLSNRLEVQGQKVRDVELLKGIYNAFTSSIMSGVGLSSSKDKLSVQIARQFSTDSLSDWVSSALNVDYTSIEQYKKAGKVDDRRNDFFNNVNKLYGNNIKPQGSDFSQWFYNMSNYSYLEKYENILIVITDGESDNFKNRIDSFDLSGFDIRFVEISSKGTSSAEFEAKQKDINRYLMPTKPKSIKFANHKMSVNSIINLLFPDAEGVGDTGSLNQSNISKEVKPSTAIKIEKELVLAESKTEDTDSKIDNIQSDIDRRLSNTKKICEQNEYINIKTQLEAYKGMNLTKSEIESFESKISKVGSLCN
jgi:hypothetical protein